MDPTKRAPTPCCDPAGDPPRPNAAPDGASPRIENPRVVGSIPTWGTTKGDGAQVGSVAVGVSDPAGDPRPDVWTSTLARCAFGCVSGARS